MASRMAKPGRYFTVRCSPYLMDGRMGYVQENSFAPMKLLTGLVNKSLVPACVHVACTLEYIQEPSPVPSPVAKP